jgi:RNA polymerase sigma-70 factor (ECF subfamily)
VDKLQSLCGRIRRGDRHAATELLELSYKKIFSYLYRLCGNVQDAEDLTQDTFAKVWSSLNSYRGQSKFLTWIYRIAYNNYLDWKQNRNCKPSIGQGWKECLSQKPSICANLTMQEWGKVVYEAVEQFEEDKKQVIYLHYYQALSLRETAKVLGIATSTVKYRLREALKSLRSITAIKEFNPNK